MKKPSKNQNRIHAANIMIREWQVAGFENHHTVSFVTDMRNKMTAGKGMTAAQAAWFDKAVMEAPPTMKNAEMVTKLRQLSTVPGMEQEAHILTDFAWKMSMGWNLSPKQTDFMNRLIAKAEDFRDNGPWAPTTEQREEIILGVKFSRRYSNAYLRERPGLSEAIGECALWLDGKKKNLSKWAAEKMMSNNKGLRNLMKQASDKMMPGSLLEDKKDGVVALVVSEPLVDDLGVPSLTVLKDGNTDIIPIGRLRTSGKKSVNKT